MKRLRQEENKIYPNKIELNADPPKWQNNKSEPLDIKPVIVTEISSPQLCNAEIIQVKKDKEEKQQISVIEHSYVKVRNTGKILNKSLNMPVAIGD